LIALLGRRSGALRQSGRSGSHRKDDGGN